MDPRAESRGSSREPGTRVKICGLRRREHVRAAERAGASYGGLVFARSPRRVSPEEAAELARRTNLRTVGVFVDPDRDELLRIASLVSLDVVQLHGGESPGLCEALRDEGLTVWKAIRPRSPGELRERAGEFLHVADALMVDGYAREAAGGTGTSVPLEWVDSLRSVLGTGSRRRVPLVLAGGLTPENVGRAIRRVAPDVVDVSSGVERRPGEKSPELIRAFLSAVRRQPEAREDRRRRE